MPYFKDTKNKVHFLEDSGFSHLLPSGSVEISDEEAVTLQIVIPTDADLAAIIRFERSQKLASVDVKINIAEDAGLDSSLLRKYRQELRDITNQVDFPSKVTWPQEPK